VPTPPVVLIPPSESKVPGGTGPSWRRGSMRDTRLDGARAEVLTAARRAGIVARGAATRAAMDRYDGVLYRELDWASLPADARRRGATGVRIVSGLFGLVAPDDPIPAYRLKMSASLAETGRLSTWWRPRLAPVLGELVEGAVVWDLLPLEHAAACDWTDARPRQRVTVRFLDPAGRTVSHWNKLLKGALVAWILESRPSGPGDLDGFVHPQGYELDPDSSELDGPLATVVMRAR
jgi:cytoplasmic iron level regulating protein YaaA (DUF328/UPF0246 family)